jgi:hypothetical protein
LNSQIEELRYSLVDTSGDWDNRGVFKSINRLSPDVAAGYELAGSKEIKDLELGSCHIFDVPGNRTVALLIAQKRREALNVGAFEYCLNHLATYAKENGGTYFCCDKYLSDF